jgi:hypothetical protein
MSHNRLTSSNATGCYSVLRVRPFNIGVLIRFSIKFKKRVGVGSVLCSVFSIVWLQCLSASPLKAFRQGFCFVLYATRDWIRPFTTATLFGPYYCAASILRGPSVRVFVRADAIETSFPLQCEGIFCFFVGPVAQSI